MDIYKIQNKIVGVKKGKVFRKSVRASKHLFRNVGMSGGWAIDKNIAQGLSTQGIETIEITDKENKIRYTISVRDFLAHAGTIDFGWGEQFILEREQFVSERF